MSASVVQSGTKLYMVNESGGVTPLVIPTGVSVRNDIPPRWVVYGNRVMLVNTPSQPLTIDSTGVVRLLSPKAPRLAPILSAVAGGALSGTYNGVRVTFVTADAVGNIISESDYSPASGSQQVSSQFLKVSNIDTSPDDISFRRIYRPTSNGAVLFQWVDLNGNILTTIQDDLTDAALAIQAAPLLGTPPRLTHIAEFRQRLFGVADTDPDHTLFTESGVPYAWPGNNLIQIPQIGSDKQGISAMIARREALLVGRRNMVVQVTGTGKEDNNRIADFDAVIFSRELGIESQETAKVFRDVTYFLWKDGVYTISSEGVNCISDQGGVRSWFVSDSYFDRKNFQNAFALIDLNFPKYRLFLTDPNGAMRFVDYDINDKTWWGPHKTDLFIPKSGFLIYDANGRAIPIIGGNATMYQEQATRTDGTSTAIAMSAIGKQHDSDNRYVGRPDVEKVFGEITLFQKPYTTGTVQVISTVGDLQDSSFSTTKPPIVITQNCAQNRPRTRLGRIGIGKHAKIEISNSEIGQDVEIFGYEIDPVNIVGKR